MRYRLFVIAVLTIIFIGNPISASATQVSAGCKEWVAKIVSVEGRVESQIAPRNRLEGSRAK